MVSSWSRPITGWPLLVKTPTTRNGWFLIRMLAPVGSVPGPNNSSRTTEPSTATLAARTTSSSVKNAPCSSGHARMTGRSALAPSICVFQFDDSAITCWRVLAPGETYRTPGMSRAIASASPGYQGRRVAAAHADRAEAVRPGIDRDDVGPDASNLVLDRRLRAVADGHHDDDGGNTDDHAERGERRPHRVTAERLDGNSERKPHGHDWLLT